MEYVIGHMYWQRVLYWLGFSLIVISVQVQAADQVMPGKASQQVTIGGGSFAPYYLPDSDSGIFPDLIKAVFREMPDYEPQFIYDANVRDVWLGYKAGRFDAVSNLFDAFEVDGCRTDPLFRFSDVVISKKSDDFKITQVEDLQGLNVVAFDGAREFFGEAYSRSVSDGDYMEVAKQELQPRMLLSGRYNVNVGDLYIFFHSLTLVDDSIDSSEFHIHKVFPQMASRMGFRDESLCPMFNQALAKVKQSGEYERIYSSYLKELGVSW